MKTLFLILFASFLTYFSLHAQENDYDKAFKEIASSILINQTDGVIKFVPDGQNPVDYNDPDIGQSRILKDEFSKNLQNFISKNPVTNFSILDSKKNDMYLPMALCKYKSEEKTFYVQIMMAKFGDKYGFLMFHIIDKLPKSLRHLDKD